MERGLFRPRKRRRDGLRRGNVTNEKKRACSYWGKKGDVLRALPLFTSQAIEMFPDEVLGFYRKWQVLHVRLSECDFNGGRRFGSKELGRMLSEFPKELSANFNIENGGAQSMNQKGELTIRSVFSQEPRRPGSWYASAILQDIDLPDHVGHDRKYVCPNLSGMAGEQDSKIQNFLDIVLPISTPRLFKHIKMSSLGKMHEMDYCQSEPVWFFVGQNYGSDNEREVHGRKEHTDSISSTGTWHFQASGTKWYFIALLARAFK